MMSVNWLNARWTIDIPVSSPSAALCPFSQKRRPMVVVSYRPN
jgi:hypothetical protein